MTADKPLPLSEDALLVRELRRCLEPLGSVRGSNAVIAEAADLIERLAAELAEARKNAK